MRRGLLESGLQLSPEIVEDERGELVQPALVRIQAPKLRQASRFKHPSVPATAAIGSSAVLVSPSAAASAACSTSIVTGLGTWRSIPAARARSTSAGRVLAVSAMTGVRGPSPSRRRSSAAARYPSSTGISQSIGTASKLASARAATACAPSHASCTA